MVPVPYLIGTTTDLISELAPSNLEDVYVVDIDSREVSVLINSYMVIKHMLYSKPLDNKFLGLMGDVTN